MPDERRHVTSTTLFNFRLLVPKATRQDLRPGTGCLSCAGAQGFPDPARQKNTLGIEWAEVGPAVRKKPTTSCMLFAATDPARHPPKAVDPWPYNTNLVGRVNDVSAPARSGFWQRRECKSSWSLPATCLEHGATQSARPTNTQTNSSKGIGGRVRPKNILVFACQAVLFHPIQHQAGGHSHSRYFNAQSALKYLDRNADTKRRNTTAAITRI